MKNKKQNINSQFHKKNKISIPEENKSETIILPHGAYGKLKKQADNQEKKS